MLELPEALTIARQINDAVIGKRIKKVVAAYSPHKFAWYHGDPQNYHSLLAGKIIEEANGYGGMVEIKAGDSFILVGDGALLRFHTKEEQYPKKHQLLIQFEDLSALSASIQMYGGLWCFNEGEFDNPYYRTAKEKASPLSDEFGQAYFDSLVSHPDVQKLSAKAFLATEQRIPGLGNGVLQDILWNAGIHPKRKIKTLPGDTRELLFNKVRAVLSEMVRLGGRDTEKDLFGNSGGYKTIVGRTRAEFPCLICGGAIKKENYLGGSIYYCENCQTI